MTTSDFLSVCLTTVVSSALVGVAATLLQYCNHYLPTSSVGTDPLACCVWLCAFFAGLCWVTSVLADNYSQVDKLWSVTPWVYVWVFAWYSQWNTRLVCMGIVSSIWGIRLTYNFARRGGYSWPPWQGEEDYRWPLLKKDGFLPYLSNPVVWHLFNFFFISVYQHILLLLIALPAAVAYKNQQQEFCFLDITLSCLFVLVVWAEHQADWEQYKYQTKKYLFKDNKITVTDDEKVQFQRGFCNEGLWSVCRHPNYTCEQFLWVIFFLFSVTSSGIMNWSAIGFVLLICLFFPSTNLTEYICGGKYPLYKEYQQQVPRIGPLSFWLFLLGLFSVCLYPPSFLKAGIF